MFVVEPATTRADCEGIQAVFNHPEIIGWLGGFCILDNLLSRMHGTGTTIWKAVADDRVVGGFVIGGRSQCHQCKFGEVGVLPEYRRRRIGTALYFACVAQAILEGRRLIEDTIVSDNQIQQQALPAFGIRLVGTIPEKTASFKGIRLYAFQITQATLAHATSRLPHDVKITVVEDYYTRDVWQKNMSIFAKHRPTHEAELLACLEKIRSDPRIVIARGKESAPHNKGKTQATFI